MEQVIRTLKILYNYMEDRADEDNENEEYKMLFTIYDALKELGVEPPPDDKFDIHNKSQRPRLSAFGFDEIGSVLGKLTKQRDQFIDSNKENMNEEILKQFKRFL